MRDAQVGVVGFVLNSINGLDSVRDVHEVDESTVPVIATYERPDQHRTHDGYALFLEEVDEFNLAVLPEVSLEPLLVEGIEVLNITNVYVTRST